MIEDGFDVPGPRLSLYPTPDLTTIGRQPPPTLVSDTLQAFPESYYKSPGSLARGETAIIRRNPTQKHIFFGGGRPRAGSSLVMSEIIKSLTWEGSDLSQFAREERLRISIAGLEWAQACLPFDLNPEAFQTIGLHSQTSAPPSIIGETYFDSIRHWIKDEQEDTIGILGTTFTFNTGVTIGDTILGQPRAEKLFRDFVRKEGMFEGLDYEAVYISTDATPEVIEFTTEERLAMLQRPPGIERENFLESRGKIIKRKPGVKMLTLTGAASEENLLAIEEDVDQTLYSLLDRGLLELPADLSGWIVSKEDLNPWLRSLAITRGLNPFIFRNLGIPRYRTSHFLNRQIHRQNVVVYRDVEEINPLIAYYPDLYEPYAMIA